MNSLYMPPEPIASALGWVVHKNNKRPYSPKGFAAKAGDPTTWGSHAEAIATYETGKYDGLGFQLSGDGLMFVDFDHCRSPLTGEVHADARYWAEKIGSYTEVSVSGTGLHILALAKMPEDGRKNQSKLEFPVELYGNRRYFTFSGDVWEDYDTIREAQTSVSELYNLLFGKEVSQRAIVVDSGDVAPDGWLEKGLKCDLTLNEIWNGRRDSDDESSCDLGLMNKLLYWSQGDTAAAIEAFRQSPYAEMKDEAHQTKMARDDYMLRTARTALRGITEYKARDFDDIEVDEDSDPDWQLPAPLQGPPPMEFKPQWLPGFLSDYAMAVSNSLQMDLGLVSVGILSVLALCLSGKYEIQGKPGYYENLNIYTLLCAPPGCRKSGLFRELLDCVFQYETLENAGRQILIAESQSERAILEGTLKTLQASASKDPSKQSEAIKKASELCQFKDVKQLRLTCDDVTPECLVSLLSEQGGKIGLFSSEGGLFTNLGRYSNAPSYDVYLKGHAADFLRVTRIGRQEDVVNKPLLTVALGVQPSIIQEIIQDKKAVGLGLLARFFMVFPEKSGLGSRIFDSPAIPQELREKYQSYIWELLKKQVNPPAVIQLSDAAKKELEAYFNLIEGILGEENQEALQSFISKLVGLSLRVCGILHSAKNPTAPEDTEVDAETMGKAIWIGNYALSHARKIYGMNKHSKLMDAQYVTERIINANQTGTISRRDLLRLCRRYQTQNELDPVINQLISLGYLKPSKTITSERGRPTSLLHLNPLFFKSAPAC